MSKFTPERLRQWAEFVTWDEPDYRKPSVKEISAQLDAHASALEDRTALVEALGAMLKKYVDLVECGDCGYWDASEEAEVIAARALLARIES